MIAGIIGILFAIASGFTAPHVEASSLSKDELVAMAMAEATAHHISVDLFTRTIECESHYNPYEEGDNGTSWGISQIHLPAHPDVTKSEAEDPQWALNWAAQKWSEGHANWWTCYNIIKKEPQVNGVQSSAKGQEGRPAGS